MSRRGRHGRPGHPAHPGGPRPANAPGAPAPERTPGVVDARPVDEQVVAPADVAPTHLVPAPAVEPHAWNGNGVHGQPHAAATVVAPVAPAELPANGAAPDGLRSTCTTAQLRRFIKSRPWVPMHELRRRFGIWGADDDVTPIRVGDQTLFIGLPEAEGRMVAELLSAGDVGYELSLDPGAPIVVGVYPMRPVPRS